MNIRGMGAGVRPPQLGPAPGLVQRQYLNLTAGEAKLVTLTKREATSLIVNVTDGVLDCWLGNHPDGAGSPDFRFTPQGPRQLFLPPNDYEFTFQGVEAANIGVVVVLG